MFFCLSSCCLSLLSRCAAVVWPLTFSTDTTCPESLRPNQSNQVSVSVKKFFPLLDEHLRSGETNLRGVVRLKRLICSQRFETTSIAVLRNQARTFPQFRFNVCFFLSGSFDTICSVGPHATSTLGGQPACDGVSPADAASPTGPPAEHQRTAQTTVAATQHAGECVREVW